jgi:hypothetical protein
MAVPIAPKQNKRVTRPGQEPACRQARELGLLSANSTITDFGRDIVERSKGAFMTQQKDLEIDEEAEQFYIPAQFRGVRRKSSTSRI